MPIQAKATARPATIEKNHCTLGFYSRPTTLFDVPSSYQTALFVLAFSRASTFRAYCRLQTLSGAVPHATGTETDSFGFVI